MVTSFGDTQMERPSFLPPKREVKERGLLKDFREGFLEEAIP